MNEDEYGFNIYIYNSSKHQPNNVRSVLPLHGFEL